MATIAIPHLFGMMLIPITTGPPRVIAVALSGPVQHLTIALSEVAMTTPNTTIDSSASITDQHGAVVANLSSATLTVFYQDGTSAAPSVTNEGSGVYTATYTTGGPGVLMEMWSFIDTSGAIAQEQRRLIIAY